MAIDTSHIYDDNQIKVSVIVPTYNHEKYIQQCLDSIINQKVDFEYEILVGEDNSTDNTREIVMHYAKKYPCLVKAFYRDGKNKIFIDGTMTGIKNGVQLLQSCAGKYIAFCDGDDYWNTNDKLQKQVAYLENHPDYVMCFHNTYIVNNNGEVINDYSNLHSLMPKKYYEIEDFIKYPIAHTSSLLFRNDLDFHSLPSFFYRSINSDRILRILISELGKAKYIDEPLSSFKQHGNGIWSGKDIYYTNKSAVSTFQAIDKYFYYKYHEAVSNALEKRLLETSKVALNFQKYYELTAKILEVIDFDEKLRSFFDEETNLYIFGAGSLGKIIYLHLKNAGVKVCGFIETVKQEHKNKLHGLSVYDLNTIKSLENTTIIVTPIYDFESIHSNIIATNNKATVYSLETLVDLLTHNNA